MINYKNVEQEIYTVTEIEYVEGRLLGMIEITTQILNVRQCDGLGRVVEAPMYMDMEIRFR
jgi:hypothetical protein